MTKPDNAGKAGTFPELWGYGEGMHRIPNPEVASSILAGGSTLFTRLSLSMNPNGRLGILRLLPQPVVHAGERSKRAASLKLSAFCPPARGQA
jgi:hypothetical protein